MNSRKGLCIGLLILISSLTLFTAKAKQGPGPGAQPATAMPSVLSVPPAAQPSANFNADAATDALPGADSRQCDRKIRCLLRRRLLAHSVGFFVRRSSLSFTAKSPLVRGHA
jgi:hypothetical protein